MNPLKAGTLDLVLLAALEKKPLYGLEILTEVAKTSGDLFDLKEGSLYPALSRLVKAGLIEGEWRPSSAGGAPRKYYRLTDDGREALKKKKQEWLALRAALDALLTRRLHAR